MPRPICVQCSSEMKPCINDVRVAFGAKILGNKKDRPYQVWAADSVICPKCLIIVVVNYASKPLFEHFQGDYTGEVTLFIPEN